MNWKTDAEGLLKKIWNVQRPSRLEKNVWKSIKEKDEEMFEERRGIFEEGLKAQKQKTTGDPYVY